MSEFLLSLQPRMPLISILTNTSKFWMLSTRRPWNCPLKYFLQSRPHIPKHHSIWVGLCRPMKGNGACSSASFHQFPFTNKNTALLKTAFRAFQNDFLAKSPDKNEPDWPLTLLLLGDKQTNNTGVLSFQQGLLLRVPFHLCFHSPPPSHSPCNLTNVLSKFTPCTANWGCEWDQRVYSKTKPK